MYKTLTDTENYHSFLFSWLKHTQSFTVCRSYCQSSDNSCVSFSFYLGFVIWIGAEAVVRLRFKKEIPCPHCGFDATWYKRDVKVAKKLVSQFWQQQEQQKTENSIKQENEETTQNAVPNSAQYESESRLDSSGPF